MSSHVHAQSRSRFSRRSLLIGGGAAAMTLVTSHRSLAGPHPMVSRYSDSQPAFVSGWLTDAGSLMKQLDAVKVIALTTPEEFEAGHIPGAGQIDWPALLVGHTTPGSIDRWQTNVQTRLRELNITPADTVVIYDGGSLLAPRLWWTLDTLGHRNTQILNGGLMAWKITGGVLETAPSAVSAAAETYTGTLNPARFATQGDVMMALGDPGTVILDARDPDEFRNGRIPGAVNYHYLHNADSGSVKIFKPVELLTAAYTALGITPDKRVIVYCSTGTRACASYFTLRHIGYSDVRLYAGSWDEWDANPYAPREAGPVEVSSDAVIRQSPHSCATCSFTES